MPFAVIIGEDEQSGGLVAVKDMRSGTQETMTGAQAAERIGEAVRRAAGEKLIKVNQQRG